MAETLEDVLARRTRALFLNAPAALQMAPRVAELMAAEKQAADGWVEAQLADFRNVAQGYLVP
jgi:glycerol-3-phosphate dehydrogenase